MLSSINKAITYSFLALFFLVPLILYPNTSEIFEFNKMVLTYLITIIISFLWATKMVITGKINFKRTLLDIPILIFLSSQILSSLVSFDIRTSLLGYYSRFHGGLASSFSYSILYWAFVSNMDGKKTKKSIIALLATAVPVCIYGVLQHFGIDKDIWVQDVQRRVFSTFGQPNWLGAWLISLIPLTWFFFIKSKRKNLFLGLSVLMFVTFLFTKSRSGILGFIFAYATFFSLAFVEKGKKILKEFALIAAIFGGIVLVIGTPWTPSLSDFASRQPRETVKEEGPALEVGGTESGEIRKIVWNGAINIWRNYPILGTGVETFAFSYYNFRPEAHNLVSEWNFLYNKAHNEYLNILATTGALGLIAYLVFCGFCVFVFVKQKSLFSYSLLAGFISILVTNFFGFSVVPVATVFFIFPAFAITYNSKGNKIKEVNIDKGKKTLLAFIIGVTLYLLFITLKYWYADYTYAKGKRLNEAGNPIAARNLLVKARNLSPKEAIYWNELADSSAETAIILFEKGEEQKAKDLVNQAIKESEIASDLSPKNVNIKRSQASMYIKLQTVDEKYLLDAKRALMESVSLAPTDAHLYYNLGLTEARLGNVEDAKKILEYAIQIKTNYRDARLAFSLLLANEGQTAKAKEELIYVLDNINPDDALVQQQLEELGGR